MADLIDAASVAQRLGVSIDAVIADILSGLEGRNAFALSGGRDPALGWCVEAWDMEPARVEMHRKRLAGGSAGSRE